ncbi:MAG: DUF1080 domain-containing protein [Candidatus Hydrogenedentes bacterium]|nr:DUF1080 domain-containing protein [Candidatus Hydrogenedentota bacterium]
MGSRNYIGARWVMTLVIASLWCSTSFTLEKADLALVFEDDFESGMDGWTCTDPGNWRIEKEEGSGNHVLSLFTAGGVERDYLAPRSVATVDRFTAGDFIFEARLQHRAKEYAHQDLCIVYNVESEYQFYYTHLAPVSDEGANTIFIVDNAERKSIATERSSGTKWGDDWHNVRIVRDAQAGNIEVFFDDMTRPIMRASDTTFRHGGLGLGSFNDVGWFDDVKLWAKAADTGAGEYVSIFDGVSLSGWSAPDMGFWSVEDGAITAESTEARPCESNQYLVWQGGDVADFELKAQFRLAGNSGNSGIQFRSTIREEDGMGIGYQADILPGGPWCGALADEYTTREPLMAPNGHKTVVDADGTRTCTPAGEPVGLRAPGEWNDYHVYADGHRIVLTINGKVSAEFIDNDEKEFDASGILALQLRSGPPMKVQFKEVYLKRLR